MEILKIFFMIKEKPFCSEKNPLGYLPQQAEKFSYDFIYPQYWLTWIVIFFSLFIGFMPNSFRILLGKGLGMFIYHTNKKRRNIVLVNLSMCFRDQHLNERKTLAKKYFCNLGRSFVDMSALWWRSSASLRKICVIKNTAILDNALRKGKGVILLTIHTTSLDFGGRSISKYPVISMYKPFRNKLINWLIGRSRCKSDDNAVIFSRNNFPYKSVIQNLKKPNIFYYIGDEDLDTKESHFADFFDERKSTLVSIRKMVELTNCSVIPCVNIYSSESDKYITYLGDELINFPTKSVHDDARTLNTCFENMILKNKSEYMWSLRIFQTREPGKDYPY